MVREHITACILLLMWLGGLPTEASAQAAADETAGTAASSAEIERTAALIPEEASGLLAVVGSDHILVADIASQIDPRLEEMLKAKNATLEQLPDGFRDAMIRRGLVDVIKVKMLYNAFLNDIAGTEGPDKMADVEKQVRTKGRQFFLENELPQLQEKLGVETPSQVDEMLRTQGSSLAQREALFIDSVVGMTFVNGEVPQKPEIPYAEIIRYYKLHGEEFDRPARARWEQLTILFSRTASREAAMAAISALGHEAYYGGNMQAVARRGSHGPLAAQGGAHPWTRQGSLASEVLDEAIFSLPVGVMSQIIEDESGLHIIKVVEREDEGRLPVAKAEPTIREKLQQQKRSELQEELFARVRQSVPVWTLFPEDVPGSMPLQRISAKPSTERR